MDIMTQAERDQLQAKLDEMIAKRPEISARIAEARAHGDLKENAEYHAAREEQGLMEAEIRRLGERLSTSSVVKDGQMPDDVVFVGCTVRIREEGDDEDELIKLVGEPTGEWHDEIVEVSVGSPMGESLMKSRVGDVVRVDTPRGVKRFEVLEIV
ncbi:MAG: transcription elongation factor GreA [Planctomycetota bacterium]|jgi:transcription elongation factor GreA